MIHSFLPREKCYISQLDKVGIVTSVKMTTYGVEYLVRYFDENNTPFEVWLYDFEVTPTKAINATNP